MNALTIKKVATTLRGIGVTISKRDGEFRVNVRHGGEATAYYTDDLRDALNTGIDMATRHDDQFTTDVQGAIEFQDAIATAKSFAQQFDKPASGRVHDAATATGMYDHDDYN